MITLSSSQQDVLARLYKFMKEPTNNGLPGIFILKGYAGTGKTTLISSILKKLDADHCEYRLMAPTGRAAKVLRDKIPGCNATTIHRSIFNLGFEAIAEEREDDMSDSDYCLAFPLSCEMGVEYIIVDESSMVSDAIDTNDLLKFGSGRLLTDLLDFAKNSMVKNIIFVGDTAQLPPVSDNVSHALDTSYFVDKGYIVESAELIEVFRQSDGGVLDTATGIRNLLNVPCGERYSLSLSTRNDIECLKSTDVPERYVKESVDDNVSVICYSNRLCYEINQRIRNHLYGQLSADMQVGDLLVVNNNSYGIFGCDVYNGDVVKIIGIGRQIVRKNVPVMLNGIKSHVDLVFRLLEVESQDNKKMRCTVLENLLNSPNRDVIEVERRALYVDFCIRMRDKGIKRGSQPFYENLRVDALFNALRVKYGYAITCHKSQGSEWNKVFVNFSGMCRLDDSALRWCYTAITRTRSKLFVVNPPNISQYFKIKFNGIETVNKLSKEFFDSSIALQTPFHKSTDLVAVRLKCRGVMEALKHTSLKIQSIEHFNWRERYHFADTESGKFYVIDAIYNGSGVFSCVLPKTTDPVEKFLCDKLNSSFERRFRCGYVPKSKMLEEHYELMKNACDEISITIANVVESLDKYYVTYYLVTDSFAIMQFYMQGNMFSTVISRSIAGNNDEKLKQLILKFQ